MINLESILKNVEGIDDYQINSLAKESFEAFFVLGKLETVRRTKTLDQKATIYVRHDGKLGQATFSVLKSDDKNKILDKINKAKQNALTIYNQDYQLVKDEKLNKTVKSNIKDFAYQDLAYKIYDVIFDEVKKSHSMINALEIFINKNVKSISNSQNLRKKETSYDIFVETIPTYNAKEMSYELYQGLNFGDFDEAKIRHEIALKLEEVENRAKATKPEAKINCPILLNKEELSSIFAEIANDLNYVDIYNQANLKNLGDNLQPNRSGDLINLSAVKMVNGSTKASFFDSYGSTLKDVELIKDGVVVGQYGNNQYAQYLNKEISGNLPCIKVKKGHLKDEKLADMTFLNCLSFSGIQVDMNSDYVGGEVRLAYYHKDGKNIPLTSISISGKLSDLLNNLKLSNEITEYEEYSGPKYALIKGFEIH